MRAPHYPLLKQSAVSGMSVQVGSLGALAFFATLGLLVSAYWYLALIGVAGAVLFGWLVLVNVRAFTRTRRNLGLLVLSVGSAFWFWSEILSLSIASPAFPSVASYAPFPSGQIPQNVVATGLCCVALFNLAAFSTLLLLNRACSRVAAPARARGSNARFADGAVALLSILGWVPFLKTFGGVEQALQKMLLMRAEVVEFDPGFASYLPIVSITAASFALVRLATGWAANRVVAISAVLGGGSLAVLSGTRFKLLFLLMPAALSYAVCHQRARGGSLRNKVVFLAFAVGIFILAAFQFSNRYGTHTDGGSISAAVSGAGHFTALTHAVALMESPRVELFMQPMTLLFVTDYVPRFLWPGKPTHGYWEFYNNALGVVSGNVTPSVIGQYFMNWGWLGAAACGVIFGGWARIGDILVNRYHCSADRRHLALATSVLAFLFLSYRMYTPMYFSFVIVMFALSQMFGGVRVTAAR